MCFDADLIDLFAASSEFRNTGLEEVEYTYRFFQYLSDNALAQANVVGEDFEDFLFNDLATQDDLDPADARGHPHRAVCVGLVPGNAGPP